MEVMELPSSSGGGSAVRERVQHPGTKGGDAQMHQNSPDKRMNEDMRKEKKTIGRTPDGTGEYVS